MNIMSRECERVCRAIIDVSLTILVVSVTIGTVVGVGLVCLLAAAEVLR